MRHENLFQLGMDLETSTAQTEEYTVTDSISDLVTTELEDRKDHFVVKDGVRCAGSHLIIDLYDAKRLDDIAHIEEAMRLCVIEAGATLLHMHLHRFSPEGVSGVAVLAESHISVHTWPEAGYAAFDVFMCGDAQPEVCVDILRRAFSAERVAVHLELRGRGV